MENLSLPTTTDGSMILDIDANIDSILREVQQEGLSSLKEIIADIEDLIEKRKGLDREIGNDLEKMKMEMSKFMNMKGTEMSIKELIDMKKKEIEIDEEKVKEKLAMWKDIANLKRELRIHVAEFQNRTEGSTMLKNLVDF